MDYGETDRQRSDREYQSKLTERLHRALDQQLEIMPKVWRKVKRLPAGAVQDEASSTELLFSLTTRQRLERRAAKVTEQRKQKAAAWFV